MAMVLMLMQVCLITDLGSLSLSYKSVIDGICVVARIQAVITITGTMNQPFSWMLLISG